MNLLKYSFSNQFQKSYKNINCENYKAMTIYSSLLLISIVPYISNIFLNVIIFILVYWLLLIDQIKSYKISIQLYVAYILIYNILFINRIYGYISINYSIPRKIIFCILQKSKLIIYIYIKYYNIRIPNYIYKIILINTIYSIYLNFLFKKIEYEFILNNIINFYLKIATRLKIQSYYFNMIFSLTSQIIERLFINIHYIYLSLVIKYSYINYLDYSVLIKSIKLFIVKIDIDIDNLTLNLSNRRIANSIFFLH